MLSSAYELHRSHMYVHNLMCKLFSTSTHGYKPQDGILVCSSSALMSYFTTHIHTYIGILNCKKSLQPERRTYIHSGKLSVRPFFVRNCALACIIKFSMFRRSDKAKRSEKSPHKMGRLKRNLSAGGHSLRGSYSRVTL
jgi:hypothetical protein